MKTDIIGIPKGIGTEALHIVGVTNRTFKCLGCKNYGVKVIDGKGGIAKTCNVNKTDVRIIVDLDAPNCTDYVYGW